MRVLRHIRRITKNYEPNGEVKLSITAYQCKDNVIEVCLTKDQAHELVAELNDYIKGV